MAQVAAGVATVAGTGKPVGQDGLHALTGSWYFEKMKAHQSAIER